MYPEGNPKKARKSSRKGREDVPLRNVAGLVVFDGEKFLLLHRALHWRGWEFPKGHVKEFEPVEDAVKRELFEETGIPRLEIVGKIDELYYFDNFRKIDSYIQNFLVRVSSNNKISFENQPKKDGKLLIEHDDYKWCFPEEAVKMLTHKNMKDTMIKAIKLLALKQ